MMGNCGQEKKTGQLSSPSSICSGAKNCSGPRLIVLHTVGSFSPRNGLYWAFFENSHIPPIQQFQPSTEIVRVISDVKSGPEGMAT